MPQVRLAILECDTPVDPVRLKVGKYGDIFEKLLNKGLEESQLTPDQLTLEFSKWDVVTAQQYPKQGEYDALLLTGSKHTAHENDPWILKLVDFTRNAYENKIPIVGICFGHQILARALGAKIGRSPDGWEIAVDSVNLTQSGKKLFGKDVLAIHQMHRDTVFELPSGFECVGSSPRCAIQGFYLPKHVFSVQGHPEFTAFIVSQIIEVRHSQGIFSDELWEDGMKRAPLPHDGALISAAICRFLFESTEVKQN